MTRANICLLAAIVSCSVAHQTATAQERGKLVAKIESNDDKVPVEVRVLEVSDPAIAKAKFKVEGLDKMTDVVALVVEWKVKRDADLAPKGALPSLKGVKDIPKPFKGTAEQYEAVGFNVDGLDALVGTKMSTGELIGIYVQTDGIAKFLWVVPKNTTAVELKLGPHKPLKIALGAAK